MSEMEPITTVTPDGGATGAQTPDVSVQPAAPTPPPPNPPKKSRGGAFFLGALSGCLIVFLGVMFIAIVVAASRNNDTTSADWRIGSKVAIVPIEGEIVEARQTIERIHRYADLSSVRAIVMRIDSPGGAIAPTQEIYEEIRKTRRTSGKPFIASIGNVGASGGFYIATACDRIIANPGSITGSIGVILQWFDVKDLLAWAKLKPETIKSGEMKDVGSPYREMTDQERAYFQNIVMQLRGQFVHAVAEGRQGKISEAEVNQIADGRVFTGQQALELKLIDELGNLDDAVLTAGKLGGISGKPGTIYPKKHKPTLFDLMTNGDETESIVQRVLSRPTAKWLYRW